MITRRSTLAIAPLLSLSFARTASAQSYPDRVVRLVVPFTPGGATDVTARLFASDMTQLFKQSVMVDNRPGAAGAVGIDLVAKAAADGYTLGVGGVGPLALLPTIDAKLPYDPARDLDIVAGLSKVDFILVARPGFPAATVAELIAKAKAEPGKITYSSAGVAGPQQLMIEHLAMLAGIKLFHVPFPGDNQAVAALTNGDVDIALAGAASALGLIKIGKLKALAAGNGRLPSLPDLPSVAEQTGFTDFMGYTWNVLVAPKGTPGAIVTRLSEAANDLARKREMAAKLEAIGLRPMPGSAREIADQVASDTAQYRRLIDLTGLRRE
ncbi:MAG: tripartite tricarboxylate transporter substrate binding protein [Reyranellaceae bacterium]